eukprot:g11276.t1
MSLRFVSDKFPQNAKLKDQVGLPWSCVVQPLAPLPAEAKTDLPASEIARCESCWAYINGYAQLQRRKWFCPLCMNYNALPARYRMGTKRDELPELAQGGGWIECIKDANPSVPSVLSEPSEVGYIFCVDTTGGSDYVDAVSAAMQAALQALPPRALVGLMVFSNKVGLYDMRSETPHVRFARIDEEELQIRVKFLSLEVIVPISSEISPALEDIVPLAHFLVRAAANADNLMSAAESIVSSAASASSSSSSSSSSASNGPQGAAPPRPTSPQQGFGSVAQALVDYASDERYGVSVRVLTFLARAPNVGGGVTCGDVKHKHDTPEAQLDQSFFEGLGKSAALGNVCFDLFLLPDKKSDMGLQELRFLSLLTGGNVMLYESIQNATLPQDLFRQLSSPQAFAGEFRLRTSPEFEVAALYGHTLANPRFENLFQLAGWDNRKTIAADFSFVSPQGFGQYSATPYVQFAFAYTTWEPVPKQQQQQQAEDGKATEPQTETEWRCVRRLRVCTKRLAVAKSAGQIYSAADVEVLTTSLVQQLIQEVLQEGVAEARNALQNWYARFLLLYHRNTVEALASGLLTAGQLDLTLARTPALQSLPRFVFGLFHSPLLSPTGLQRDERVALQCLFSALEPTYICLSAYPTLLKYNHPEQEDAELAALSARSLQTDSSTCAFLLDSFFKICVWYSPAAVANVPFPPSASAAVRVAVKRRKAHVPLISPAVHYLRGNEAQENEVFMSCLIEDGSPGVAHKPSFDLFYQTIAEQVVELSAE